LLRRRTALIAAALLVGLLACGTEPKSDGENNSNLRRAASVTLEVQCAHLESTQKYGNTNGRSIIEYQLPDRMRQVVFGRETILLGDVTYVEEEGGKFMTLSTPGGVSSTGVLAPIEMLVNATSLSSVAGQSMTRFASKLPDGTPVEGQARIEDGYISFVAFTFQLQDDEVKQELEWKPLELCPSVEAPSESHILP
jgi:hypothetical protein